jgi:hypothetical protein
MVLVIAKWEAGPRERWPKTLKEELVNISRKPRDLTERHNDFLKIGKLTLSKGKMNKKDDDDDDVLRTIVPQDQVQATLFNEELFLRR